mgnify:CR=1 FL=1|jgi:hypothetical protein
MANLFTKNGKPLQVHDIYVYSRSGKFVGHIDGDKVFGPNGRYIGTIDSDRLIYRSPFKSHVSSPISVANRAGIADAHALASALWGDEPDIDN